MNKRETQSLSSKLTKKIMGLFILFLVILNLIVFSIFIFQFKSNTKENFIREGEIIAENVEEAIREELSYENITSEINRNKGKGAGYNRHINSFRRIDSLIKGLSTTSIYLLDENLNVISEENPKDLEKLLADYDGEFQFYRDDISLIRHQDKLITPLNVEPYGQYFMVMESQEFNLITSVTRLLIIPIVSSIFALIIIYFISKSLIREIVIPIETITDVTKSYRKGDYDKRSNINQNDEIGILSENIDNFAIELKEGQRLREEEYNNQKEFIANISHELRTPVSVMSLTIEKIEDMDICKDEKTKEYIEHLRSESKHLNLLVNDLITLTKLENPKFKLNKSDINLKSVIDDSIRSMRFKLKEKELELVTDLPKIIRINGDYERIRQMITIFLDNGIKFSKPKGKIEIKYENSELEIKDYGVGIEEKELDKIFDRYYRGKTDTEGSGLGLAIAKQIAERHNMELSIDSEIDKFTEIKIKIN